METISDLMAARTAIASYLASGATSALPEATRDAVIAASAAVSPVDQIMSTIEALYAAKADLDDAARVLVARLTPFAMLHAWHGINEAGRGAGIVTAMQRDLGQKPPSKAGWPAPDADPKPDPRFAPVAAAPMPLPAPAAQ